MRVSAALAALLSTASALSIFDGKQAAIADDKKAVPGESPLVFCHEDRAADIVTIENVDLEPNPPQPGQPLVIKARGVVHDRIVDGAVIALQVKYGLITLIKQNADLCEVIKNVDIECPIEEGPLTITKTVDIPREIPPGKYTVHADVFAKDGSRITCLDADVSFGTNSLSGILDL